MSKRGESLSRPAGVIRVVTPSSSELPDNATYGVTRAILCSASCTADLTDATGTTTTSVALPAGYNPLQLRAIANVSTGTIWALY